MDRRESLKSMMVASIAGTAFISTSGCKVEGDTTTLKVDDKLYGRIASEKEWDKLSLIHI